MRPPTVKKYGYEVVLQFISTYNYLNKKRVFLFCYCLHLFCL